MNDDDLSVGDIHLGGGASQDYLDVTNMNMASTITSPYTGGYTISTGTSGAYLNSNGTWNTTYTNPLTVGSSSSAAITVSGDAKFEGDLTVKGRELSSWMEKIEKRLAILVPNPKKLEQYEALKKAYNHYKMLEALCEEQDDESK